DHLLFLIQQEAFSSLMARLEQKLTAISDPEDAIRAFIENHVEHFVGNPKQAQVLTHESNTLRGPYPAEITSLKRKYYRQCLTIVEQLKTARQLQGINCRLAVLSLFGMMNWIYTWYNPAVDGDWQKIAGQMSSVFLNGVLGASAEQVSAANPNRKSSRHRKR
ncbi:MAG: hypothetical protein HY647_11620, partial [Acidobacteria bacterium]|nr:hypothetical protein [Acidobacteriota bacterium]